LFKGIQTVTSIVEFSVKNITKAACLPDFKVEIFCDNKASIAWSSGKHISTKALEKRALARLCVVTKEELVTLKRLAQVTFNHVAGVSNERADLLSRMCSRYAEVLTQGGRVGEVSETMSSSDPSDTEDIDDVLRRDHHIDNIFLARDKQATDDFSCCTEGVSIAEKVAKISYNLQGMIDLAAAVMFVFKILKLNAFEKRKLGRLEYAVDTSSVAVFIARSCQLFDLKCRNMLIDSELIKTAGPIFYDGNVLKYRSGLPDGHCIYQLYIPKSARSVRSKLIWTAHREVGHAGVSTTVSNISTFFSPALKQQAKNELSGCIPCKLANSKRDWTIPPECSTDIIDLSKRPAYYCCGIDYLALGEGIKCLTVTCKFSRHCTWLLADSETSDETIRLLKKVQLQRGCITEVFCDRAAYFRFKNFEEMCRAELGIKVSLISPRAPHEGGWYEKLHDLGLRRLRQQLRHIRGKISLLTDEYKQLYLDKVCLMLNTRPIGYWSEDLAGNKVPVTPDYLCIGYTRGFGCIGGISAPVDTVLPYLRCDRIKACRKLFLEEHWTDLKNKSFEAAAGKQKGNRQPCFKKNDPVLVFRPSIRKLEHVFTLAHVVSDQEAGCRRVTVNFSDGTHSTENVYNLIPCPALSARGGVL
jgi:hypothetical protein